MPAIGLAPVAFNRYHGFTLIEMMTVIVIIAVLATLVFPIIQIAKEWMREKRAMVDINNIVIAVKNYRTTYAQWPGQIQSVTDTCYVLNNAMVIGALTNNPRGEIFLHYQQSSLSTSPATRGAYLDPWLHPYVIVMDENGDNRVTFNTGPVVLTNLGGKVTTNELNFIVDVDAAVVSWGKLDTNLSGSLNMDLCSWQSGSKTK